jgi:glyoxylate/hydroxypyruvate reductase
MSCVMITSPSILAALEEGALAGAILDVFPIERLSIESPLWGHPKVTITSHNAAQVVPQTLAVSVLHQIDRIDLGHPPESTIDRVIG